METSGLVKKFGAASGPLIIAHRGASAYYPENTLPAIEAAIRLSAQMVEVDVQETRDEAFIVAHDTDLKRTASLQKQVLHMRREELREVDVGSWFHEKYADVRIPDLDQVLSLCKDTIPVNLELKFKSTDVRSLSRKVERVIARVRAFGMTDQILLSGFDTRFSLIAKRMCPEMATGILYNPLQWKKVLPSRLVEVNRADFFHCSHHRFNPLWQKDLETAGIPVNVYTVNSLTEFRRMAGMGVDGVFTDYPDVLLKQLPCKKIKTDSG